MTNLPFPPKKNGSSDLCKPIMSPVLPSTTTQSMASEANQKQLVYMVVRYPKPGGRKCLEMAKKRSSNKHRFLQIVREANGKGFATLLPRHPTNFKKKGFHILPCESDYVWSSINLDARKYIERHCLYWFFNHMDSVGRRVQPRHNHPMQTDAHPQNPRSPGVSHERNHYMTNPNHAQFFFRKSLKMTHRCALFDSAKDGKAH